MAYSFSNLRVSTKLGVGFGLVLTLTLIVMITGWRALDSLIDRGSKLASIAVVDSLTKELRINRLNFEIHKTEEDAQLVESVLEKLNQQLLSALDLLVIAADRANLERQLNAVHQYQAIFRSLKAQMFTPMTDEGARQVTLAKGFAALKIAGDTLLDASRQLSLSQIEKRNTDTQQARYSLVIAAVLALASSVLAAWLITGQIVQPLRHALHLLDRIASGNLSAIPAVQRRDELGDLQRAMQRMTCSLRDLISGIGAGATQIAGAAEELSAVTEQTSAGVNSQKTETDQIATAMQEMAATVQEVARNAEHASIAATRADGDARQGEQVVGEVVVQIERLAEEVRRSTEAMAHLEQESERIGSVLEVIKSVADQTNLLALNAAIEAARAGEAGRGFAVVADEVRGLAQRTRGSAEEIDAMVSSLQAGTQHVANAMRTSHSLSDRSVELTRHAGTSLVNIVRSVSDIQSMNQHIAAAAEQQSVVADGIGRSILNVRDVSEQTAAASAQTAASSVNLAQLGAHLQGTLGKFSI